MKNRKEHSMIATLKSTTKIVSLNGVPARIWEGTTASGIKVHAYITRVAVSEDQNQEEFARELAACAAPSKEVEAIPMRMII
jgi:hypothetical protein